MRNKILVWCREQALFPSGAHVVCAVSGGADSVAMLHALCALRAELGITVSICVSSSAASADGAHFIAQMSAAPLRAIET